MGQLPLALSLNRHASFDSFVAGDNATAIEHIRSVALGQRRESVWIAGPPHTGKTHLLAAACRAAGDAGARPIYIALEAAADPGLVEGLQDIDLIALDGAQRVAGDASWEAALFALMNARLERGGLLLAADGLPRECGFALPDLVSRATAATAYRIVPLDDESLGLAVMRQASARGLELDAAAASYLLQRVSRDIGVLAGWLDRIDRFSLATQRRISIPLLRQVIEAPTRE